MTENNVHKNNEDILFEFIAAYMPLTEEEKRIITDLAIFKTYPKGKILFQEGDFTNESYFVMRGCIRTYTIIDNNDITIEFYTELDSFSPTSTIEKRASHCFATCLEESILLVSTPDLEKEVFSQFPRFETLCRILTEKLMAKQQLSFEQFKSLTPEQRYLHLIEARPELLQRIPQYHLATYLGIRPESLSRIRKRLTPTSTIPLVS